MSHDSRLLSAYLSVASAAKEARYNAPQRSDVGALIARTDSGVHRGNDFGIFSAYQSTCLSR